MSHKSCCVPNCSNTWRSYNAKFIYFPRSNKKLDQRNLWLKAINRKNADGSDWTPRLHDVICSDHFVGGCKSSEPNAPNYVPTIFSKEDITPRKKFLRKKKELSLLSSSKDANWTPRKSSKICSEHFAGGKKSEHPLHVAYVPTIFPNDKKKTGKSSIARFDRQQKRDIIKNESRLSKVKLLRNTKDKIIKQESKPSIEAINIQFEHNYSEGIYKKTNIKKTYNFSCQYDFSKSGNNSSLNVFICNLIKNNKVNDAEVQITSKFLVDQVSDCNLNPTQFVIINQPPQQIAVPIAVPVPQQVPVPVLAVAKPDPCLFNGIASIKESSQLSGLTGINMQTFELVNSSMPEQNAKTTLTKKDKLLLFLMKIKTAINYSGLSILFNIHRCTVSSVFLDVLKQLGSLKKYIYWLDRKVIKDSLPFEIKRKYEKCKAIITIFEVPTEKPKKMEERKLYYSKLLNKYSLKFLVAMQPNGYICFVSKHYGGSKSDSFITSDCGFTDLIERHDLILTDEHFVNNGYDLHGKNGTYITPTSEKELLKDNTDLSRISIKMTVQTHLDRFLQRLRLFSILSLIQVELVPVVNDIMMVCCALANLLHPNIKSINAKSEENLENVATNPTETETVNNTNKNTNQTVTQVINNTNINPIEKVNKPTEKVNNPTEKVNNPTTKSTPTVKNIITITNENVNSNISNLNSNRFTPKTNV